MFIELILFVVPIFSSKHESWPSIGKTLMVEPINTNHLSTPPSSSPSPSIEEDPYWNEVKRNCIGCWSGGVIHTKYSNAGLSPVSNKMNIRLEVDVPVESPDKGQWSVWNARKEGEKVCVPIRKSHPDEEFSTHKVWFERILLRISKGGNVAVEVGFWDKLGDGTRRTVVAQYDGWDNKESQSRKIHQKNVQHLSGVCIIQQKIKESSKGFIGNAIDYEEASILPETYFEGSDSVAERLKYLKLVKSEYVEICCMKRSIVEMSEQEKKEVAQRVIADMNGSGNEERLTQTLPNRIAISLPITTNMETTLYFGNEFQDGKMVILELQFDNYEQAVNAAIHTFN